MTISMIYLRGDVVRRLRGRTPQLELSRRAGLARTLLIKIELGQVDNTRFDTVNRLAVALGVDASVLVGFEPRNVVDANGKRPRRVVRKQR